MNCIVTDIDGTIFQKVLSSSNWEKTLIERPPQPIVPMRTLLQSAAQGGMFVIYATARREVLRSFTNGELLRYAFPTPQLLEMRPDDLRLAQDVLKLRYLEKIRAMGWQPVVWFEDDANTVEALRKKGVHAITC